MAGVGAHGSSPDRGTRRGRRGGVGGRGLGGQLGGALQGTWGEGTTAWFGPALACCCAVRSISCVREETAGGRRKKEEKKEKRRKERKKRKKYGKFSKLENFRKIKDNL
jgi:hypothetical protein